MEGAQKLRTIPPSRFQRTLTDPQRDTIVILDATASGIKISPNTSYSNFDKLYAGGVFIYSEKVTVVGATKEDEPAIATPDSDLTLCATNLEVNSPRHPALISSRGRPGVGVSKKDGESAHSIRMFVDDLSNAAMKELKIDARGGSGANLLVTETTGPGGNGGQGGNITVVWRHKLQGIQDALYNFKAKWRFPAKWTEEKEEKATMFYDDHVVLLELRTIILYLKKAYIDELHDFPDLFGLLDEQFSMHIAKGQSALSPETGYPLRSVYTVTVAINGTLARLRDIFGDAKSLLSHHSLTTGGRAGRSQDTVIKPGQNGENGQDGEQIFRQIDAKNSFDPRQSTFVFAHPTQSGMLLERAKTYLYLGTRRNRIKAEQILATLIRRLSFVDEELFQASENSEFRIPLLKAYATFTGSLDSAQLAIRKLRWVNLQAIQWYTQLTTTDIDYYGHPGDWVPRLSLETFQTTMDQALMELQRTEDVYLKYLNESEQKQYLDKNVAAVTARVKSSVRDSEDDIARLKRLLSEKYQLISDTRRVDAIMKAKTEAYDGMLKLQNKIENHFEINVKSLLAGLVNVAGGPNKFLVAAQGASLVYEGFTTVPNTSGDPVPKTLLVKTMKKGANNVSNLKQEMLDIGSKTDGSAALDVSFSNKLLVDIAILDQTLDEVAADQFGTAGGEAKKLLKKFSDLVVARNNDIVEFNVILKTIVTKQNEVNEWNLTSSQLSKTKFDGERNNAANLNNMSALLEGIYDNDRERVMKLLSYLQRALRYRLLDSVDHLDKAFEDSGTSEGETEEAALSMTAPILRSLQARLSDRLFDVQEKQSSDKSLFPAHFDNGGVGKLYKLTSMELKTLLSSGKVRVKIAPVDAEADDDHERASEFRGCADLRIYRARFWLHGIKMRSTPSRENKPAANKAKTTSAGDLSNRSSESRLVSIKMTHLGTETIISTKNEVFNFWHEPISITFSYRLYANGKFDLRDSTSGDIVNFSSTTRGVNSVYAAPSPFAEWEVSLSDMDTENLDLSGVTQGMFEFFGSYRSFT